MSYLIQTPTQLGAHLRALRLAKNWTQGHLGQRLGLSQSRIAKIELDPLSVSAGQLLQILRALDASLTIQAGDASGLVTSTIKDDFPTDVKSQQADW